MMNYAIFVVSLADEDARRNYVKAQFSQFNLEPEFINAIDLRDAKKEIVESYQHVMSEKNLRVLRSSEIGCALSHLKVAQEVINRNLDYALVTEDDVCLLNNPKDILTQMPNILQLSSFEIAILGYVKVYKENLTDYYHRLPIKSEKKFKNYTIGNPWKQKHCGAVAYILTQEGARKLLCANTPVSYVADAWDEFAYTHHIQIKHIRPSIAIESLDFISTNDNDKHRPINKTFMSRLFHGLKCKCIEACMNYLHISPR